MGPRRRRRREGIVKVGEGGEGCRLAVWNGPLVRGSVAGGSLPFGGGIDGLASGHDCQRSKQSQRLSLLCGREETGDTRREVSSSKWSHRSVKRGPRMPVPFPLPND